MTYQVGGSGGKDRSLQMVPLSHPLHPKHFLVRKFDVETDHNNPPERLEGIDFVMRELNLHRRNSLARHHQRSAVQLIQRIVHSYTSSIITETKISYCRLQPMGFHRFKAQSKMTSRALLTGLDMVLPELRQLGNKTAYIYNRRKGL
jgi:hypothetical protein